MSDSQDKQSFEQLAEEEQPGIVREFIEFLRDNKKWWLLPILAVVAIVGAAALLSGSAAAPFIYTLF